MADVPVGPGHSLLLDRFGGEILERGEHAGQRWVTLPVESIEAALKALRDDGGFALLEDLTAVDYLDRPEVEGRFRVVYHLVNMETKEVVRLKALVEDEDVEIPTASGLFATADWLEREVYDMFGLKFAGHPDLRRILMAEDFEDFPLRRDFPWHGRVPLADPMREEDFARGVSGEHPY